MNKRIEEGELQSCSLESPAPIKTEIAGVDNISEQSANQSPLDETFQINSSKITLHKQEDFFPQSEVKQLTIEESPPPTSEGGCGDYCCAIFCPIYYVSLKRGCCGSDCWINMCIGFCCGWPCSAVHAMAFVGEPDKEDCMGVCVGDGDPEYGDNTLAISEQPKIFKEH